MRGVVSENPYSLWGNYLRDYLGTSPHFYKRSAYRFAWHRAGICHGRRVPAGEQRFEEGIRDIVFHVCAMKDFSCLAACGGVIGL